MWGGATLLGCATIALLRSPARERFGISESRAQAIYGFSAVAAAVALAAWVHRTHALVAAMNSSFDVERDWPVFIGGLIYVASVFVLSCFVGTLFQVLYYSRVEQPRRLREQRSRDALRRQQQAESDECHARAEARARSSRFDRERRLLDLELFYNFYEPQIRDRFSRGEFQRFVNTYLGADVMEQEFQGRAGQLQAMIERCAEAADPPDRKVTVEDLTGWYTQRKSEVERLPVDESFKEDYLVQLNERYAELCSTVMEKAGPTHIG